MKISEQGLNYFKGKSNLNIGFMTCLLLIAATLIVYWNVQSHEFVTYDDPIFIDNPYVQQGININSLSWGIYSSGEKRVWIPMTWFSHMLDYQLFGRNPGLHHLINLFIHIASAMLLFSIFNRATGELLKSAFVAALFALHPLSVEPVAWIAARKDVLSSLFWMLTLFFYIIYSERPNLKKYLLMLFFFILGLLTKPNLIILPFVFLLFDFWPLKRFVFPETIIELKDEVFKLKWNRKNRYNSKTVRKQESILFLVLEKIPFFILIFVMVIVTIQSKGTVVSIKVLSTYLRIANSLTSYLKYIIKTVYPDNLAILYPYTAVSFWATIGSGIVLLIITFLSLRIYSKRPYVIVGWLWFIGTLVPVIGLIPVGIQVAIADRYSYIPNIGLFIMIAWGGSDLFKKLLSKKVLTVFALLILIILMTTTWFQVQHWKNSFSLYQHALNVTENNYICHNNIGITFVEKGAMKEAVKHYSEALKINPDYAEAYTNMGFALGKLGHNSEAFSHYQKALKIKSQGAHVYFDMGNLLSAQGKKSEAIEYFRIALRINPEYAEAHNNIGIVLFSDGKITESIKHLKQAIKFKPDYTVARNNLNRVIKFNAGNK